MSLIGLKIDTSSVLTNRPVVLRGLIADTSSQSRKQSVAHGGVK